MITMTKITMTKITMTKTPAVYAHLVLGHAAIDRVRVGKVVHGSNGEGAHLLSLHLALCNQFVQIIHELVGALALHIFVIVSTESDGDGWQGWRGMNRDGQGWRK